MAALFLSSHYSAPAMLFALLLGMALSFLYQPTTNCCQGIDFSAKYLLRAGIALLGFRIATEDFLVLGWSTVMVICIAILSTIVLGLLLSHWLRLDKRFGALSAGAVSICGASAALAISAVLPDYKDKEKDTLLTVISVTTLSTIAMIAYPLIVDLLSLTDVEAGIFLGGTIHDVAQVVGAGYSVSQQTGELSTLTKLIRVAMLLPVVVCFALVIRRRSEFATDISNVPILPRFLLLFILFVVINNLVSIPEEIHATITYASSLLLLGAIVAIGLKSNFKALLGIGYKPICLILFETMWIAICVLTLIWVVR